MVLMITSKLKSTSDGNVGFFIKIELQNTTKSFTPIVKKKLFFIKKRRELNQMQIKKLTARKTEMETHINNKKSEKVFRSIGK